MQKSATVRSIQKRLFLLLLRAFMIAVAFLILFTLLVTGFVVAKSTQSIVTAQPLPLSSLETYYLTRGDWSGVNTIFTNPANKAAVLWKSSILLNAQGQVVVLNGQPVDPATSPSYQPVSGETVAPIVVNGAVVGKLIVRQNIQSAGIFAFRLLEPAILASLVLAVFATLIGLLLTRRVVSPLAEVIAAAEEIAGGRLQTRIRVKGPDDLRDLSSSFNKMADALERNDRERRDMLADIAHELRTPLTVIRGRLEGIMDGIYPADQNHVVPALEEAYLLERLVEDLRLMTLAEIHQLTFEKDNLDLIEIARRSIGMFQAEADEKKISLSLETSLEQALVVADPLRTEQVIGNLLSNALRYVPESGRVWVEISRRGDELTVSMNDNGPGIPEADLPFIFNRFWRGEKSRSRASGGVGLGLAIAKLLVEGQGGHITACNLPGGGLQVSLSIPAAG